MLHAAVRLLGPVGVCALLGLWERSRSSVTVATRTTTECLLHARRLHNVLLASYSVFAAIVSGQELWRRFVRQAQTAHEAFCAPDPCVVPVPLWEASKWWELLDLVFLILAGKPVSRLLWFHHATAPMLSAANVLHRPTPTKLYHVAVYWNACVHVLVYSHFARPMPRLRRIITFAQAAQHVSVVVLLTSTMRRSHCGDQPVSVYGLSLGVYAVYAALFCHLYWHLHHRRTLEHHPKHA